MAENDAGATRQQSGAVSSEFEEVEVEVTDEEEEEGEYEEVRSKACKKGMADCESFPDDLYDNTSEFLFFPGGIC